MDQLNNSIVIALQPFGQLIGSLLILQIFGSSPKKLLLKFLLLFQVLSLICSCLACLIPKSDSYNIHFFLFFSLSQLVNGFCCGGISTIVTSFVPVLFDDRLQEIVSYLDASIICGMNLGLVVAGGLQMVIGRYWAVYLAVAGL
jgi:MFS family permease